MAGALTASMIGGSWSRTVSLPMRETSVTRPSTRLGSRRSTSATASSGVIDGPILTPIGFAISAASATWAPSSWRVRSPIHSWWAESRNSRPSSSRSSARS